ncbi:MAG: hypothetical protein ACYS6K_27060 [Planctomycetota bacterium]|jgi:hypothetical protein
MRVSGIIHQQICQLKWHLLACLGLTMVLPVEEAIVNLRAGDGFFTTAMTFPSVFFGPLLAGLIACANVQADLNDKRYIFWRSKPANVKLLLTIKFFTGLIASLIILACPVVFAFVSNLIWNEEKIEGVFFEYYVPLPILIAIMTYSLCFACNVLVRKTARAWLIGMLTGCFLLVLPFMLPLDFKDFVSDVMLWSWGPYLAIMLVTPVAAFVFALYAAKYDWHLKTNLKGLLWAAAGLAFFLLMLFSSQVANIKVLQEKEIESSRGWRTLNYAGNRIVYRDQSYIDTEKNTISLSEIKSIGDEVEPSYKLTPRPWLKGYRLSSYPRFGKFLYKDTENGLFSFSIHVYHRTEGEGRFQKRLYEKAYLISYKHSGKNWMPVCELDISDCLTEKINPYFRVAMRIIDNKLIACVNNSCVVVDAADPGELKLINMRFDIIRKYLPFAHRDRKEEFTIDLVPIEEIGLEERIRLSIDLNYQFQYGRNNIYESSIVDIQDDRFAFFFVDFYDVSRFDVIRWDNEKIYCRFSNSRPFTILEVMTASRDYHYHPFVKNGKKDRSEDKYYLYLLKNPE